jgi:tetratricopeptide (TPR) repeat protein
VTDADAVAAAQAHQARFDELWDFDDPAASEARFLEAADPKPGIQRDVFLTQYARAAGLQGRHAEALVILDSLESADAEVRVRVLLESGRVLNSSGKAGKARPLFEQAFAAASAAGLEFLAIDALHMLAIVAPAAEQPELLERAIAMAESASDPRAREWLASLLNNYGWTRFDAGQHVEALALFERALVERERKGGAAGPIRVARWCVARTLRELGRVEEALAMQRQLAAAHAAAGTSDTYVDEEIAACEAALASTSQA